MRMRIGTALIGSLLVVGGIAAIVRPAVYFDRAAPDRVVDTALHDVKADAAFHRIAGYASVGIGIIFIVVALTIKGFSAPEPHNLQLPSSGME
jgi:hypothetical protein